MPQAETVWILRHALRNLIKHGDTTALGILGYHPVKLKAVSLNVSPRKIPIGASITAELRVIASERQTRKLLIDWVMYYARAGGRQSAKVFKGKEIELRAGDTVEFTKRFDLKPRSTRILHAGTHRLEVQINGHIVAGEDFVLGT